MEHLQVATFKSIRDELLANTIETGAAIVQTYIPDVSEDTLCLPYRNYVKSEGYIENDGTAKGFVISPWSGKSPNPDYVGDQEVLYEDVNFRFKSEFRATNCTITPNSNNTLLLGSNYKATVVANTNYKLTNVTVNGTAVTHSDTTATINLDNILGDVIIVAEAELNKHAIDYREVQSECVTSSNTATEITHGETYVTTLSKKEGYATLGAGRVTVGGVQKDSWNEMSGSKQISVVADGDIYIEAACGALEKYPVTLNAEGCVVMTSPTDSNPTVTRGDDVTITLEPASGYTNIGPGNIKVGGSTKDSWNTKVSNRTTTLTNVTGPVVITVTGCGDLEKYIITLHAEGCVSMSPVSGTEVERGSTVNITLSPTVGYNTVGAGYVTVNGVHLSDKDWGAGSSEVELQLTNVDGNIEVYAACGVLNEYTITYKYQDTNGNTIHSDDVVQGIEHGTSVNVNQKRIPITHYTFQSQNPEGNITITQDTTVILTYSENPKYNVTVKYVDQNNNEIATSETITGKYVGDEITSVTIKTIEDYNYDSSTSTPLPFTVTSNPSQNIIYVKYIYDPGSVTLTVNYVDDLGGSIPGTPSESRSYTEGTQLTPQQLETSFKKVIQGYEYTSGIPSTTLVMDESKAITLVYTKQVTLTVEYQDENGDPIPNQQSETHVYPRGTELDSSDLAEFIRTIENYTYDSTIPSSVTMSQDQTVVIKYTLDQQCIELDPEFGVQAQLVYEGENSVEIIYHTLINGVSQEVHEDYSIVGETPIKEPPVGDAVYAELENLYGEDFKGYIIGTLNGCDGDINFKIYVIHCSGACLEVVTENGCVEWNKTLVYSTDGIQGDYRVFILQNGVRQYLNKTDFEIEIKNKTEDMQDYDPDNPSKHIYWKQLKITYQSNETYGFIPVCEYYIIYTHSDENIYSVYTDTGNQVEVFKKGDNVTVKHQNHCDDGFTRDDYIGDVFFTVIPENGSKAWNTLHGITTISAGPVLEKNAFKHEIAEGYELLKSWDTEVQDFDYSFIDSDKKSKLGITDVSFIKSTANSLDRFKATNYDWFYLKQGEFEPILLKRQGSEYYNIYPKFMLSLQKPESTSHYVEYLDENENSIWLPNDTDLYKCNFLTSTEYYQDTFSVYGCSINGNNYVFPTRSYSDIVRENDLERAYMSGITTYGVGSSSNTACYVANKDSYDNISKKYIFNSYIIPFGLVIEDFLPESGESETITVYQSMHDGEEIELSKNKLDTYGIRNLGSDIEVYVETDSQDKCNNYLCHKITNLNGDIYLWNGSGQTLPSYCETYYYDKNGELEHYTLKNKSWADLSWRYTDEDEGKVYNCSVRVRCDNDESNPANCHCNEICSSEVTINFLDCNGTTLKTVTGTAITDYPVGATYDENGKHGSATVSADCNNPTITENVYVETWIECLSPNNNDTFTVHFKDENGTLIRTESFPVTQTYYTVDKCGTETYPTKTEQVTLPSDLEDQYYISQSSSWNKTEVRISCNIQEVNVTIYEKCQPGSQETYYLGDISNGYVLRQSSDSDYEYETTIIASSYDDVQIPTNLNKTCLTELCEVESIPITASYETQQISQSVWKLIVSSSEFTPNTVRIKVNVSLS